MSGSVTIVTPETKESEIEAQALLGHAQSLTVACREHDEAAQGFLRAIVQRKKVIVDALAPAKSAAHKAHKELTMLEAKLCDPLDTARAIITGKVLAFQQVERRKAEAEAHRLQEEARKVEQARRQAELDALEAARKVAEEEALCAAMAADEPDQEIMLVQAEAANAAAQAEASRIAQEPITAPVVRVAPAVAEVKGVANTGRWKAEMIDKLALIRHVAENPQWVHVLTADMTVLNGLARSQKEMLQMPGVRAVREEGLSIRA